MSEQAREIRNALCDPRQVCEALGLAAGRGTFIRQSAGGITVRCPAHEEKGASCSVTRGPDGTIRVRCFGCGFTSDVLGLIAEVKGLSTKRDFKAVLIEAAHLGGLHAMAYELESGTPSTAPREPLPPPRPEVPRTYPPAAEITALLAACIPVTDDAEVVSHLVGRGLDPEAVAETGMAVALPADADCGRAFAFQGAPWTKTGHRIVLPVRDASGVILSVRAWRVREGESPKRLPPGGYRATGLVLASPLAVAWLSGTFAPTRVLVVEGEPDALHAALWPMQEPTAVIGIVSGSWSRELAARFLPRQRVFVWTHLDPAGEKYAHEVTRSIRARGCAVERWAPATEGAA